MSGAGSITEQNSNYVEHQIQKKNSSSQHAAYLQDTPHFLRIIDKLKRSKTPSKYNDSNIRYNSCLPKYTT